MKRSGIIFVGVIEKGHEEDEEIGIKGQQKEAEL